MGWLKYNDAPATMTQDATTQFYGTGGKKDNLVGTGGADGLWGGDGDVMTGGAGNDTYFVKSPLDQVVELAGGGTDRIVTWMSLDLSKFAQVENLIVSGNNLFARGNDLDNIIEGGNGGQEIYGGRGLDVLLGGAGADTFVVIKGEGSDVIGDFNASEDKIRLTAGFSDFGSLQAKLSQKGADVHLDLGGGEGLILRNMTVGKLTAANFELPAGATATPAAPSPAPVVAAPAAPAPASTDGYAATKDAAAALYGKSGVAERLVGTAKNESLWGGDGDTLIGGAGDDTYLVKSPKDQVIENAGEGVDKIVTWMSADLRSFANVENLMVNGDRLYARGNDLDNIIEGGGGSQEITGGAGRDLLLGGAGADTFVFNKGDGRDTIGDFSAGEDKIRLSGLNSFAEVKTHLVQQGADVQIDLGGGDALVLRNVNAGQLSSANFEFPTATPAAQPATPAPVQSQPVVTAPPLTPAATAPVTAPPTAPPTAPLQSRPDQGPITELASATKDASAALYGKGGVAETLVGTAKNESLWGGDGDTMIGGAGDDTYLLKSPKDHIVELANEGSDKIVAWMNVDLFDFRNVENAQVNGNNLYVAGNNSGNILEGGSGSQQLYGAGGQDVLIGGAGADTFIVIKGEGNDVITDFSAAEDRIRLSADLTKFQDVQARLTQVGADVRLDMGGGDFLTLRNVNAGDLTAKNFQLEMNDSHLGKLTFSDEFTSPLSLWDRESAPTGTWRPDYGYYGGNTAGSYSLTNNGEKQIYTSPYFQGHNGDFSESPFVNNGDGTMSIWAQPSNNSEIFGYGYTSGLITTKESFAQTYGYFEIRADVPDADGAWPAFWLLPKDGSWPPEIDIMEVLSNDSSVTHTTMHSSLGGHTSQGSANFTPETADGMHEYGLMWTPKNLIWYVDDVEVFRTDTPSDMHKPMFMLANMALGGWGGAVDATELPAEFQIDYIRAYELPSDWATF